ncbi:MAG: hypothetical protein AB9891_03300 [Anaerolineaceae bacterium]
MNQDQFIKEISRMDFDLEGFTAMATHEEEIRRQILELMLTHPQIMVYYNCFEILKEATRLAPEVFYEYWDGLAELLDHKNSYHRDFGLVLLANLTSADRERKFLKVFDSYLGHLYDVKFMTGQYCARNLKKIAASYPDLTMPILTALLNIEFGSRYSRGQLALIKYEVLEYIESVRGNLLDTTPVDTFILAAASNPSPKTREKAIKLVKLYSLDGSRINFDNPKLAD